MRRNKITEGLDELLQHIDHTLVCNTIWYGLLPIESVPYGVAIHCKTCGKRVFQYTKDDREKSHMLEILGDENDKD